MLTSKRKARTSLFLCRDVAQSGSALEWGSRGRRFKSFHPDQKTETPRDLRERGSLFCFWRLRNRAWELAPFPLSGVPACRPCRGAGSYGTKLPAGPWTMGRVSGFCQPVRQALAHKSEPPAKRVVCSGPIRACYRLRLKTLAFTLFKPSALAALTTP